ncbi:tRNA (N(6)-L-threonylcarbamoyladenosine(37)-C(2))-methylthiotransferase MtaB [Candidatus Walczuchella endosymbiont of Icerya purchasi]|uniref:tRNA (N(6)-L-threonylcarbamoyladenosine(37)-C(2))- methylthiotransferase MtaB n=1 Tax=Candidatus Walczuchella endosymbiont of Icerya purchasi TaxID=3066219 RepID=UPI00313E4E31
MISAMRVAFYTMGCKLNFAETSTISRTFLIQGYSVVKFEENADIYVISTCSVTKKAEKEFIHIVRMALKRNPKAFIIAIGCYAQLNPEELSRISGVDLVLGINERFKITDYLYDLSKKERGYIHSCSLGTTYIGSYSIGTRTRAFLKIQDGCDYKCSYCTIPLARGISRSDSLENVVNNAKEISRHGVKEIVLTGVNIGEFGNKTHQNTFLELIESLDGIKEIDRFRVSSIEPNLLRNEIIEFIAQSRKFVPHFHVPLQSGSNDILRKMRRRYLRELYADKVEKIKLLLPQASIGTDVIVGFPYESDKHFIESFRFLSEIDISYLHVFTYSERKRTEAIQMEGIVPKNIRYKRNQVLKGLSVKKRIQFYESQIGTEHTVLFEDKKKEGCLFGYTENYVRVKAPLGEAIPNTLQKVRLKSIDRDGIMLMEKIR